ncbi:MAG: hypothetical protein RL367_2696 [Pseudomonadota bacterium]
MYAQPARGPAIPPVIAHIYLSKRKTPVVRIPTPPYGILAELAELRRH